MKLSSYNIKWIVLYIIYALWMLAEYDFGFDYNKISDCMEEVIWLLLLAPLLAYLLFPLVYKYIGTWKPIRWIDGAIDYIYSTIREPSKQHKMNIEKSAALSTDRSIPMIIPKKDHWIWKVLKVLLWVAVIWGILILIYVIPALGVPVAALAGFVGVKMTKKEKNK